MTTKAAQALAALEAEQARQAYDAAHSQATPAVVADLESMASLTDPTSTVQGLYRKHIPAHITARYEAAQAALDAANVSFLAAKSHDAADEQTLRQTVEDQGDQLAVLMSLALPGATFVRDSRGRIIEMTR